MDSRVCSNHGVGAFVNFFFFSSSAEVVTGFFCEHAFEMARSEKDSLIQVRPLLLTRIGVYGMWDRSLFAAAVVQGLSHAHLQFS